METGDNDSRIPITSRSAVNNSSKESVESAASGFSVSDSEDVVSNISSTSKSSGSSSRSTEKPDAKTEFVFPKLISDYMVLQRNATVKIWGQYAKDGEVFVTLRNKKYKGICKNGNFEVLVNTGDAGGPFDLTVSSKTDSRVLKDVLIGDVYLCSGQSNMLMQVGALTDKTLRNQPVPDKIRLFHVWTEPSKTPKEDFSNKFSVWTKTNDSNIGQYDSFSAVAYIFGKTLYDKLHIPIGLIQSCEGGTIAAAWIPEQEVGKVNKINQAEDSLQRTIPSRMYNGMIHPLRKYSIKGVLWYQGESDLGNNTYEYTMSVLIKSWRNVFKNDNMTFTIVQLPRWGGANWFDLREQQKLVATNTPNCTYSVNLDCGENTEIHPQDKTPIGVRAAHATLRDFYKQSEYKKSPALKSYKIVNDTVHVEFSNIDKGLIFKTESLPGAKDWTTTSEGTGFEIRDSKGAYFPAVAKLQGNTLLLSCEYAKPTGIRYGYGNFPEISLFDKNGLPAEQFSVIFK